ncbi:MAG: hypothetical protein KC708_25595 [Anaerolineae bacterium]|nr:hypothetical protein [Anaerolineae bacterium]
MEKLKRKHGENPRSIAQRYRSMIILLLLLAPTVICGAYLTSLSPDLYVDDGDAARLLAESYLSLDLPVQASNFYSAYKNDGNQDVFFRFEIPAEIGLDWAADAPCFEQFANRVTDPPTLSLPGDWWRLQDAEIWTESYCGENPRYVAYIDETSPDTWIVYVHMYHRYGFFIDSIYCSKNCDNSQ